MLKKRQKMTKIKQKKDDFNKKIARSLPLL